MSDFDETLDFMRRNSESMYRPIFQSPQDAPAKCEPNGGDKIMLSYLCPRPECAAMPIGWSVCADPRAWGVDRDFDPELDTRCFICGTEGELQHVESGAEMLRRMAPELGT